MGENPGRHPAADLAEDGRHQGEERDHAEEEVLEEILVQVPDRGGQGRPVTEQDIGAEEVEADCGEPAPPPCSRPQRESATSRPVSAVRTEITARTMPRANHQARPIGEKRATGRPRR